MTKDQVTKLLSNRNTNFYVAVNALKEYISEPSIKAGALNAIVSKAKNNKGFTGMDLFKYFYDHFKNLTEGTQYCPLLYNSQMLLKTVWETSQFQNAVVMQIRNGYRIIEIKKEDIDALTEKELRLRRQAEIMRAAKAKKAAEQKALDDTKKQIKMEKFEQKQVQATAKKLTPEQEEQIRLLKNLTV